MLLFVKEKISFLSVPKTGTTAWHAALGMRADLAMRAPPAMKHMTLRRWQTMLQPALERAGVHGIETVAVIREPEDWLGSWYRYRQRPSLAGTPVSTRGLSFEDFVRAYLDEDRPPFADIGSQARFLTPAPGGRPLDRLFRHDDPATLRKFVEARLDQRVHLARRNESPPMTLALSRGTRAQLQRACRADYELYESRLAA